MAIRTGERVFGQAVAEIDEVEQGLAWALERTSLPDEPDRVAVAGSWWRPTGAPGAGSGHGGR